MVIQKEPMVKGAVVNGYIKFVKRKWGISAKEEMMNFLGIKKQPKDGEWVSLLITEKALAWIGENKGEEYVREAGRYALKDLGIFKYLIASLMTMDRFLERAESTYSTIFNYGKFVLEKTDEGAIVTLKDVLLTEYSSYSRISWHGAFMGIMDITKTNGTVKIIPPDGERDLKYELKWR